MLSSPPVVSVSPSAVTEHLDRGWLLNAGAHFCRSGDSGPGSEEHSGVPLASSGVDNEQRAL